MTNLPSPRRPSPLAAALFTALLAAGCSRPAAEPAAAPAPPANEAAGAAVVAPAADANAAGDGHAGMEMAGDGQAMDPNAPMAQATTQVSGRFGSGQPVTVVLQVTDMMSGKPMGPDAFEIAHTRPIHVLGVDPSLDDYSHSHPEPTGQPGQWTFTFTPKFNRPYHLWLDVKPVGGVQAYVMLAVNDQGKSAPVHKATSLTASVGDVGASLSFDAPLVAGQAAMGHVLVTRAGKPFAALEPVMGAYSHIVGIAEDWSTIAHVHPMGSEPTRPGDRGGPAIDFHLEPKRAGFLKLFAQIQVDGRDVYLPFGVEVAAAAPAPGK